MFLDFTQDINSPEIFRKWAAIAAVAASMERKCWVNTRQGAIYPNLFTLLVSTPGIGKTEAIKVTEDLWQSTRKIIVAPHSLTKAALIDCLQEATQTYQPKTGLPFEYHSMAISVDELGTLVPAHDLEFLSVLNKIYDNPKFHKEKRRHFNGGKEIELINPQLNILAGSQPAFMAHMLPEEAWGMGFTSRIIMVYTGVGAVAKTLFTDAAYVKPASWQTLSNLLSQFCAVQGQFAWTDEAKASMETWYGLKLAPIPEHSKLLHYVPRRILHIIKLCMVSSLSRQHKLLIDVEDFNRARDWLIEAEATMPDIFREMVGKSDQNVITELHFALWREWLRTQKQPIHQSFVYKFLINQVPSDKMPRILEAAERANLIKRIPNSFDMWQPVPKHQHGVE